jgi:Lysine-specific metallo-endopeptidase
VAGTNDTAYGQVACRQLAINNPSDAIANADSYAYFAANDPRLSMPYILSLNDIFRQNNIIRPVNIRNLAQSVGLQPPISLRELLIRLG